MFMWLDELILAVIKFQVTFCFREQQEVESGASTSSAVPRSKPTKRPLREGGKCETLKTRWAWNRAFSSCWHSHHTYFFSSSRRKQCALQMRTLNSAKPSRKFLWCFSPGKQRFSLLVNASATIYWDFCRSELEILTIILGSLPHYCKSQIIDYLICLSATCITDWM